MDQALYAYVILPLALPKTYCYGIPVEFQNDINMAIVFQNEGRHFQHGDVQIRDISKMYLDIVAEVIEQGQYEGIMRKDLYVGLVKRFVVGAVDGVINTWLLADGKYDLVSMADPLVDLFLNGIGCNDSEQ